MAILNSKHPNELGRGRDPYTGFSRRAGLDLRQHSVLRGAISLLAILIIPSQFQFTVLSWAFALVSRPGWHEIWAPYFVIAPYSGVALVILVTAGFRRGYHLRHLFTSATSSVLVHDYARCTYLYLTLPIFCPAMLEKEV